MALGGEIYNLFAIAQKNGTLLHSILVSQLKFQ